MSFFEVRIVAVFLVAGNALSALADGKVFPPTAFPANVAIPDQRALLHFSNGVERLVIETRFSGTGTNFAWVVPFPSPPEIEEATTGLFPTIEFLFRPEIRHAIPRIYLGGASASSNNPVTLSDVRQIFSSLANQPGNPYLGGNVREEDSPGNFVLRDSTNGVSLIFIDADGAEVEPHLFR